MDQVTLQNLEEVTTLQTVASLQPVESEEKPSTISRGMRDQSSRGVRKSERNKKPRNVFDPSQSTVPAAPRATKSLDPYPMEVPNVAGWSAQRLYEFLRLYLPGEAEVFLQQQIDGDELLSLRRRDIVKGMPFSWTRSLRVYRFVVILQSEIPGVLYDPIQRA